MTEKDLIKRAAFKKLDKAVRGELKYLEDAKRPIGEFSINSQMCDFTDDEHAEVETIIEGICTNTQRLQLYCHDHDIESPFFINQK